MRICWTGTFVPGFERNKRLREYLEAAEVDVNEIRVTLWPDDRVAAFGQARLRTALRMLVVYPVLFLRILIAPAPDVYLVSYPGWFDVPVVKTAALLKRRPVVFDIFISLCDTAVADRRLVEHSSVVARVARFVDRLSIRWSDRVLVDCPPHARFLSDLAGVAGDRFGIVYVGADETVFTMSDEAVAQDEDTVLFYGTYVPLQGVEWIVRAATLVPDGVRFRLIGRGQARDSVDRLAERLGVDNVDFIDFMTPQELAGELRMATLCLGIFGTSDKANRVVPHKVYEALACGRPVLTSATDAVAEVFDGGEVATCRPGDPEALAAAIASLLGDRERRALLARAGFSRFEKDFGRVAQGERLRRELDEAVSSHVSGGRT